MVMCRHAGDDSANRSNLPGHASSTATPNSFMTSKIRSPFCKLLFAQQVGASVVLDSRKATSVCHARSNRHERCHAIRENGHNFLRNLLRHSRSRERSSLCSGESLCQS